MRFLYDAIYGRISFCAREGFCELFLSLCNEKEIQLENVKRREDGIDADVRRFELKKVFEAASSSGMNIKITRRRGLPDILIKYRKRLGIPFGILLFAVIIGWLGCFVWSVDISVSENIIPYEEFVSVLEANGIRKGVLSRNIDYRDVEYILCEKYPQLQWINIRCVGSRIFVTARQREEQSFDKEEIYSNIVASKDGEIVRADIFSGEGVLYPGTAVVRGDLLVSGIDTFRDGAVRFLDAKAVINAITVNYVNCFSAREIQVKRTDYCKDRYLLYMFGLETVVLPCDKCENFTENAYFFSSSDVVFPLGIIRQNHKTMKAVSITLDEGQSSLLAFYDFSTASLALYEKVQVLEREISLNTEGGVSIDGRYKCIEDIAEKKRFTVESEDTPIR